MKTVLAILAVTAIALSCIFTGHDNTIALTCVAAISGLGGYALRDIIKKHTT